jgi:uncharacterized DUF497 family protein
MTEWDEAKNLLNVAKHGVSFDLAQRIFDGPVLTWIDDRQDYGETREISIGKVDDAVVLTVAHTDRSGVRRLISARRASRRERSRYEEALR